MVLPANWGGNKFSLVFNFQVSQTFATKPWSCAIDIYNSFSSTVYEYMNATGLQEELLFYSSHCMCTCVPWDDINYIKSGSILL